MWEKIEIYRNNFSFHATRFEEWMNGLCYNKGTFETDIVAESTKRNIHFYISEIGNFKISKTSVLNLGMKLRNWYWIELYIIIFRLMVIH